MEEVCPVKFGEKGQRSCGLQRGVVLTGAIRLERRYSV